MVKLSPAVSGSQLVQSPSYLEGRCLPALFRGLSSVLEYKAAVEGLAIDSRCSTYCSRSHNEVCITYQIGMLDTLPS